MTKRRIPKEGLLLPVKRLGPGKYMRRRVKTPAKIERGEKLQAMWEKEWDEAEVAPVRYVHIQWKGEDRSVDGGVIVRLRGRFYSEADIKSKAEEKVKKWTGEIPYSSDAVGPSPGLVIVSVNKKKMESVKHWYDPKRTTRVGRYGLGYGVKNFDR